MWSTAPWIINDDPFHPQCWPWAPTSKIRPCIECNASLQVVELSLIVTMLSSLLDGTLIYMVDWNVSFSVMWRNSFTISELCRLVYQSAPVVDMLCRLFRVGNAVLLPVEGPFVEHPRPLASLWTRFLMNRLTQTFTQFGSVVLYNCFQCLPWRLTDFRMTFHSINSKDHVSLSLYTQLLTVPRHNLSFGSRSFRISAPKNWNTLPLDQVRQSRSLSTFRNRLKTFCFRSAYPSS